MSPTSQVPLIGQRLLPTITSRNSVLRGHPATLTDAEATVTKAAGEEPGRNRGGQNGLNHLHLVPHPRKPPNFTRLNNSDAQADDAL